MQPLVLTASTVVSALGAGAGETLAALQARRSGLRPCDFGGIARGWVGQVDAAGEHALAPAHMRHDCRNNRLAAVALGTDGFAEAVAGAVARHGADRIGLVIGTSTSGVQAAEDAFRDRDPATGALPASFDFEHTHDMFSAAGFVREALGLRGPAFTVSTACASSAKAFIDAHHLIESGVCDAAVVGGVDSLCRMTLLGFAALDLVSDAPCRPCDADRQGISIGEAAGFALLERGGRGVALLGYGATSDGYHMSSPHPEGIGAIGAMRGALDRAGLASDMVDYVNLHGTGTRANDAMEDRAVHEVFGADGPPCSSTKGWSGHTHGACGVLEAVIAGLCIRHGFVPGCLGVERLDPAFRANVATENASRPVRRVLSNSFGFGGINCSLIFGLTD